MQGWASVYKNAALCQRRKTKKLFARKKLPDLVGIA